MSHLAGRFAGLGVGDNSFFRSLPRAGDAVGIFLYLVVIGNIGRGLFECVAHLYQFADMAVAVNCLAGLVEYLFYLAVGQIWIDRFHQSHGSRHNRRCH